METKCLNIKRQLTGDPIAIPNHPIIDGGGIPWHSLTHTWSKRSSSNLMEDICDFCRARLFWVLNLNENLCNIYRKLGWGNFKYEMSSMRDRLRERGLWGRMDERKMDWGDLKIKLQEANHMIVRGPRLWLMQFTHSHRFTTGRSAWLHSMGFSAFFCCLLVYSSKVLNSSIVSL